MSCPSQGFAAGRHELLVGAVFDHMLAADPSEILVAELNNMRIAEFNKMVCVYVYIGRSR